MKEEQLSMIVSYIVNEYFEGKKELREILKDAKEVLDGQGTV